MRVSIPEWPEELKATTKTWNDSIREALDYILQSRPMFEGVEGLPQDTTLGKLIADAIMPTNMKEAAESVPAALMPAELALNYRSPDVIQALRRVMAGEQRARGPVTTTKTAPITTIIDYMFENLGPVNAGSALYSMIPEKKAYKYLPILNHDNNWFKELIKRDASELFSKTKTNQIQTWYAKELRNREPDPADLILRGSWFHGMSPEARRTVANNLSDEVLDRMVKFVPESATEWGLGHGLSLPSATNYGLPGSSHAFPGAYVRFGEPYGVSLSASPTKAGEFSADEYIHRVLPLYGGNPVERTIQLWRPEGARAFNEGYNEALNMWIGSQEYSYLRQQDLGGLLRRAMEKDEPMIRQYRLSENPVMEYFVRGQGAPNVEEFNRLFSDALQSKGYRGVLYSPKRYGEYEMLMLDPKNALPLDYRRVQDYHYYNPSEPMTYQLKNIWPQGIGTTPGAAKGYVEATPEFNIGTTSLQDVFNLQPWTERISQENWRRILENVDESYRDLVVNQLFGRK